LKPRGWTRRRVIGGGAALSLLAGCAGLPRPAANLEPWPQRLAALQRLDAFELEGRLAASDGNSGFSAGLRWRQRAGSVSIDLTAPLGVGAAHIEQGVDSLQVTTSQGQTFEGAAAEAQLSETLGFEPPMHSLSFWLRGASDPDLPAEQSMDSEQRLAHLTQDGWQVDFPDYLRVRQLWLPQHVTVTRGPLRLRLVVHAWRL
jgi:outer membrane lipoprotein LolB